MRFPFGICLFVAFFVCVSAPSASAAETKQTPYIDTCLAARGDGGRVVCADIAAIDQTLVYNRFGSFNPFGMIFALNRDLAPLAPSVVTGSTVDLSAAETLTAASCAELLGTETRGADEDISAGNVRLRDCKRPRPMVLRVNVGDTFIVHVTNLLHPGMSPDFSSDFCKKKGQTADTGREAVRGFVAEGDAALIRHGEADCLTGTALEKAAAEPAAEPGAAPDWPNTRAVNFVVQGLAPLPAAGEALAHPACFGTGSVGPGDDFYCRYQIMQEGTYFFGSLAAPAGGEGNGGSLVHGLFGAVVAEKPGSRWYRSQTARAALDAAWPAEGVVPNRTRTGSPDYEAVDAAGIPILNMARPLPVAPGGAAAAQTAFASADAVEIVHSDLNAIIYCDTGTTGEDCAPATQSQTAGGLTTEPTYNAFREFSVFFHDELKTFYTRNFRELGQFGQLAGVKDGFAINYGASGMGSLLLANRKGIGPADDCMECLYEEFFLASWANGDPALLEWYPDDPSNVHHSYLNDPVVFRNFHAGPKETHVFHLHAHQWFAGNDPNRGSYLDSQTVAPQQGFTYNIYHGGLRGTNGSSSGGWWDSQGSGNRNRTIGDSIFHCHLYPHFAQGMWELWRVHDVLEDGTRLLPDGQLHAGLSVDFTAAEERPEARAGSIDRMTGAWLEEQAGTPIPALVPLPGEPLPLVPTYAEAADIDAVTAELKPEAPTPMPGFPFYIAGQPGHRPPQAPLDIARNLGSPELDSEAIDDRGPADATGPFADAGDWLDGGLNRHVVSGGSERKFGIDLPEVVADPAQFAALDDEDKVDVMRQVVAKAFALGDLSGHLTKSAIDPLNPYGERLERAGMGFHYNGRLYRPEAGADALRLRTVDGDDTVAFNSGGYATPVASAPGSVRPRDPVFGVNGAAPRPGAPFADPCGNWGSVAANAPVPGVDPFTGSWLDDILHRDARVAGFRRYEASAVQLDMIVNRAGWHDPQARINVLTAESDPYKSGPGLISPRISDSEEPFFFRALSGECIEFRHTNELPKELELDDFQVRTPTDTIGQHIHLVKFDVTSSDGSGNGWNYEDGTFAPDEIATRLCSWVETGDQRAIDAVARIGAAARAALPEEFPGDFCDSPAVTEHRIWRLPRSQVPFLFQTTTQRWFADPILSKDENGQAIDRTMRTVFTHDHFGPSSIQQHGFYAALVIEPPAERDGAVATPQICETDSTDCVEPLAAADANSAVAWGSDVWEGTRKLVRTAANAPFHPSYREFALSIADFALLYDPRDKDDPLAFTLAMRDRTGQQAKTFGALEGMSKIYCEARYRLSPFNMRDVCGTGFSRDEPKLSFYHAGDPPAWLAGGAFRDDIHRLRYQGDLLRPKPGSSEIGELFAHLVTYRQKAAGTFDTGQPPVGQDGLPQPGSMASPVAAPVRPESISVDHHDPYLVSYRGAPLPLRVGDKDGDDVMSTDCRPMGINRPGQDGPSEVVDRLAAGNFTQCSYSHQIAGDLGDMGGALHSGLHGDPETPLLEAYAGERLVFRMVQGAQEVQHTFTLAGQPFKRNIDQAFAQGMRPLAMVGDPSLQNRCQQRGAVAGGHPAMYRQWWETAPSNRTGWTVADLDHWTRYEAALAECDNVEGFMYAQEIGISEHFEMQGSLRADVPASVEFAPIAIEPAVEVPTPGELVPEKSSDYLYHFGTIDALWNGAWGLVRIFEGPEVPDPATRPELNGGAGGPAQRIGDRLVGNVRGAEMSEGGGPTDIVGGTGLSCPIPTEGDPPQRVVDAAIVAFETRRVFDAGRGTVYGETVYDPDGMMLALMAPEQLGIADIADDAAWNALTADNVVTEIRNVYGDQPEPFVLRVHAGDCLRLRIVNLLGDEGGKVRDLLGDAILPKIVPLNADPVPQVTEHGAKAIELARLPDPSAPGGVRPSAKLALSLGLPGLDLIRDVPLGFGYNRKALAGGNGGAEVSRLLAAYAGRYRIDLDGDAADQNAIIAGIATAKLQALVDARPESLFGALVPEGSDTPTVELVMEPGDAAARGEGAAAILGREFFVQVFGPTASARLSRDPGSIDAVIAELCGSADCPAAETLVADLRALTQLALRQAVDDLTHWVPYAFGATPVKPTGDVISQTPHGIFGAIDVIPVTWTPLGEDGMTCDPTTAGYERCSASYVPGRGAGQGMTYTATSEPGAEDTVRLREFVLFYQDGLNHWDDASRLEIKWADTGLPVLGADGARVRMVPDCPICDDSYDRGEVAVSQHSPALSRALRELLPNPGIEESDDLNAYVFPPDYTTRDVDQMRLSACAGEQIVIRVVHPGGRARQRAFAMNGYSYDELFPGFGFPRSALLAPGKTITAWLRPEAHAGTVVWHDGPTHLRAGGTWGLIDVAEADSPQCEG